ncbi:DUF4386 domain-containing protein [Aeromicrobium sp. IC_218]|uniref:DUF4386 domain-containing protein n=1 Tax=Aeromicrobium sp. IC_218 TaxID=2545468 RepID=UPI00103F22F3|nr:DUF4386 domain-containing protein [Aeromicrobium sp. IC_218]TCJ00213.1 DUF4386 domain-containing protein [Aeromicrobium sp. IC_218]
MTTLNLRSDHAARTRAGTRLAGALYLLTFLTSVPTLALYAPLREHDFLARTDGTGGPTTGAALEVALAVCCVGTAVVLVPLIRRHGETLAVGYLAARVVEGALILVGVGAVLTVLTLRDRGFADADATAAALVGLYDATFLLGQSVMPALCALTLGTVLYRARLVPRIIPAIGLVGAPLLLASDLAQLTGLYEMRSPLAGLGALPIAAWELSLGVWLIARGFYSPRT